MNSSTYLRIIIIVFVVNSICFSQFKRFGEPGVERNAIKLGLNSSKHFPNLKNTISDSSHIAVYGPTDDCDIYLRNRSLLKEVTMVKMVDSILYLDKDGVNRNININEINKVRFAGPSGFWTGAAIGAGISVAGWTLVALAFGEGEHFSEIFLIGLVGGIPSGLLGGLIGLIFEKEDAFYDFSSGNPKAKLKRLRYIIHEHTPRQR